MLGMILKHVIVNIILFVFCAIFMLGDDNIVDNGNKTDMRDVFECYLLCVLGFYVVFGLIWLMIINGGRF